MNKNINYSFNPKISTLLPLFNSNLTIQTTINSIRNQNMKEIEIILIDDHSLDNTIEIIEKLEKEDKRIKILKNKINKGTLYSRSIGALNSKGKYIMSIDQDDLFIKNIFNICYKEAIKHKIDIIEFSGLVLISKLLQIGSKPIIPAFLRFKKDGKIIKQPKLSNFIYQKNNNNYFLIDALIWGKCIKSNIYIKALYLIGEEIYNQNVCWSEDRIVNFALFRVANSFKYINRFGVIHQRLSTSIGNIWIKNNIIKIIKDEFINIMSIYKITRNSIDINIAFYEFEKLIKSFNDLKLINKKLKFYIK